MFFYIIYFVCANNFLAGVTRAVLRTNVFLRNINEVIVEATNGAIVDNIFSVVNTATTSLAVNVIGSGDWIIENNSVYILIYLSIKLLISLM